MTEEIRCTNHTQFNCASCDDPRKMIPDSYCYRYIRSLAECGEFIDQIGIQNGQQIVDVQKAEQRHEFQMMLKLIEMGKISEASMKLDGLGFDRSAGLHEISGLLDEHGLESMEISAKFGTFTIAEKTDSEAYCIGLDDLKRIMNTISAGDVTIELIRDRADLIALGEEIMNDKACCILGAHDETEVTGLAIVTKSKRLYYIPMNHRAPAITEGARGRRIPGQLTQHQVAELIRPWIETEGVVKLISHDWHNGAWVCLRKLMGMRSESIWWDTMIAEHIIDSRLPNSLHDLAEKYIQRILTMAPATDSINDTAIWICRAVLIVSEICGKQFRILKENDQLKVMNIEMDCLPTISEMEYRGLRINRGIMNTEATNARQTIEQAETPLKKFAGNNFNPGSDEQVRALLFRKMKLGNPEKWKALRLKFSGSELPGVDSDNLMKLKTICPDDQKWVIDSIRTYRGMSKYLSTYAGKVLHIADQNDIIHFRINQIGTQSGRPTSCNPNILNLPNFVNKIIPVDFKAGIVPMIPGNKFVIGDFCQQELRKYAVMAKIQPLIDAFESNVDIHQQTGDLVCPAEWSPERRRKVGKALNFGMVFGMGYMLLADSTGLPLDEAKRMLTQFKKRYGIDEFRAGIEKTFLETGYSVTPMGRRRYFSRSNYKEQLNSMCNHPIQGGAADYQKMKLAELCRELAPYPGAAIVMAVYDDIAVECSPELVDTVTAALRKVMTYRFEHDGFSVKMEPDIIVSDSLKKD